MFSQSDDKHKVPLDILISRSHNHTICVTTNELSKTLENYIDLAKRMITSHKQELSNINKIMNDFGFQCISHRTY